MKPNRKELAESKRAAGQTGGKRCWRIALAKRDGAGYQPALLVPAEERLLFLQGVLQRPRLPPFI